MNAADGLFEEAVREHPFGAVALALAGGFALGRSPRLRELTRRKLFEILESL